MKNIRFFLSENFHFLVVKFSIYLNRCVFVMLPIKFFSQLAFRFIRKSAKYILKTVAIFDFRTERIKKKIIFKIAAVVAILDFRSERFQLFLSTSCHNTFYKFRENWPFGSVKEMQNKCSMAAISANLEFRSKRF